MEDTTASRETITTQGVDETEGWSLGQMVAMTIVISIMIGINVVGNCCTIIAFRSDAKLRTFSNFYIFNLAVTDLFIGFVSLPFYTAYTLMNYTWPFGRVFCKIYNLFDYLVCVESSFTILCISVDRLLMVKLGPGLYQRMVTKRRTLLLIATTWLISAVLYGPAIVAFDIWRGYSIVPENDCFVEFLDHFKFTAITSIFDFFTPSIAIVLSNVLLYLDIRRRSRSTQQVDQGCLKRDLKAAKNLALLVALFLMCWAPYTTCALLQTICSSCVNADLFNFFVWLLWMNSSINPIVYAASNPRFRSHYYRLLCSKKAQRIGPSESTLNTINSQSTNLSRNNIGGH
ncbi:hypothetical protein CAPTEDRAFT_127317 [Capitella teleta]|uniref:G-protein coupled receptors family 1 profile domain-containing protein n=1 Tax=Capitella teleta TaxID=283909 RepID=R7UY75_CAPTE|nr:hypothetical protein CAPTEDRAFT_127317 [Capitella teleta]|eukprot:ELU08902.1 hypothetical protein CAPTEDRAFT_127317 [Capitella teleta]